MSKLDLSRVNIIGCSGSGKSTFAKRLAKILDSKFIEMDSIYWGKNWSEPTDEELFARIQRVVDGQKWVLDGNYTRTNSVKWPRTTTVVWIDTPYLKTIWRVNTRSIKRLIFHRGELWEGTDCYESFKQTFMSKKSVILWAINQYGRYNKRYEEQMTNPPFKHLKFIRLKSQKEIEFFLTSIG